MSTSYSELVVNIFKIENEMFAALKISIPNGLVPFMTSCFTMVAGRIPIIIIHSSLRVAILSI